MSSESIIVAGVVDPDRAQEIGNNGEQRDFFEAHKEILPFIIIPRIKLLNPYDTRQIESCCEILNDEETMLHLAGSKQTPEKLLQRIKEPRTFVFVAENYLGEPVGTVTSIDPVPLSLTTTNLTAAAVRADMKGKGIGTQMHAYVLDLLYHDPKMNPVYSREEGEIPVVRMNIIGGVKKDGLNEPDLPMEIVYKRLGFRAYDFDIFHLRDISTQERIEALKRGEVIFEPAVMYRITRNQWPKGTGVKIAQATLVRKFPRFFS
ncbi:GNAT family N-acetyltransferase [Candidatus Roizmanbacteria bacterium]|nr:GNAT family N-acetyltransferase [Candidatus Roizmanbacteria bacterium]